MKWFHFHKFKKTSKTAIEITSSRLFTEGRTYDGVLLIEKCDCGKERAFIIRPAGRTKTNIDYAKMVKKQK